MRNKKHRVAFKLAGVIIMALGATSTLADKQKMLSESTTAKSGCPIAGLVTQNPAKCWNTSGCKPVQVSLDDYKCVNASREENKPHKK